MTEVRVLSTLYFAPFVLFFSSNKYPGLAGQESLSSRCSTPFVACSPRCIGFDTGLSADIRWMKKIRLTGLACNGEVLAKGIYKYKCLFGYNQYTIRTITMIWRIINNFQRFDFQIQSGRVSDRIWNFPDWIWKYFQITIKHIRVKLRNIMSEIQQKRDCDWKC